MNCDFMYKNTKQIVVFDRGMNLNFREKYFYVNIDVGKDQIIQVTTRSKNQQIDTKNKTLMSDLNTPRESPVNLEKPIIFDNV